MRRFAFELVAAAGIVESVDDAVGVNVPGAEGRLGILGGHQPLVAALVDGMTHVTLGGGGRRIWKTGRGLLLVGPAVVRVLVRQATPVQDHPGPADGDGLR